MLAAGRAEARSREAVQGLPDPLDAALVEKSIQGEENALRSKCTHRRYTPWLTMEVPLAQAGNVSFLLVELLAQGPLLRSQVRAEPENLHSHCINYNDSSVLSDVECPKGLLC